jgi:hypothetical protein
MTTELISKAAELPDSSFAYIEPGGAKDAVGKTAPRSLRHLPYKSEEGVVDLDSLAEALNAVKSTDLPRATQARIYTKLETVAQRYAEAEGVEKYITHEGGKWQVHAESGKVLGTHDSHGDAVAQLGAIEANKHPKEKLAGGETPWPRRFPQGEKEKGGGSVHWPVMPRPGFRGSSLTDAGEKAPNQKGAKAEKAPEWTPDAKASQKEAEKHGFEEALKTDAGVRLNHEGGSAVFITPGGDWHHADGDGKRLGTGWGHIDLGTHLGKQPDHQGAVPPKPGMTPVKPQPGMAPAAPGVPVQGQPPVPGAPVVPGKAPAVPAPQKYDPEFEKAYEDFKAQVKAAFIAKAGPGSRVQTLIFDKDKYPKPDDARGWAKDHGFEGTNKIDETSQSYRIRQAQPDEFSRMRTISLTEGVSAVIGFPKKTIKAVQQAFFLTASGRLAFKSADIEKAEAEPYDETMSGTIFRIKCAGQVLYFAASGEHAVHMPGYQFLSKSTWIHVTKSEEQRYTLTVVYPCSGKGTPEPDFHGDIMSEVELEKSAWGFMEKGTDRIGLMHRPGTSGAGKVVESYIWRAPEWKVKDMGGNEQSVSPGDWVMGIVWTPEAWTAIKNGQITGVSLQGAARKEAW